MTELSKNLLLKWQQEYDQEYWHGSDREIEETMKEDLHKKFKAGILYLDKDDFNRICFWKAKRNKRNYSNNSEDYIKYITKQSFSSLNDRFKIEVLTLLNGVQYPVASTILHFAFPDKYPIIDWRVLWSLSRLGFAGLKQPDQYTYDFYHKYMSTIRSLSKKFGLNIRVIDKALWKYADNKEGKS